jgi:acyl-CoA dehydrogenase
MKLIPQSDGTYKADGSKYYIGNGNIAALVSVHGRYADTNEHVFFAVESQHHNYKLVKKINTPGVRNAYVAEFELVDYPITKGDILSSGQLAWDSSLSSVNIGKFQLGFCSTGICTHAFYEAITHASNRILYGKPVTNFPHIKKFFIDSYARLNAMKLYALRSLDYFRSASNEDRRYLLYNPIQKMKVTKEGEKIIDMLLDSITAKGYEQDTYFESAVREIGMIPRLEGTVHVNIALVIKFLQNYFFNPVDYPVIPKRDDPGNDTYPFHQYTGGLAKVRFPDYRRAYEGVDLPNVNVFKSQIELFKDLMSKAAPTPEQQKRVDYMLALGEMFTLIVYAQLVLENCKIYRIEDDLIDQIFNFMVRDFSQFALNQVSNFENSEEQKRYLQKLILTEPVIDPTREKRLWDEHVSVLSGAYQMNP